jgi:hypothetical protein
MGVVYPEPKLLKLLARDVYHGSFLVVTLLLSPRRVLFYH